MYRIFVPILFLFIPLTGNAQQTPVNYTCTNKALHEIISDISQLSATKISYSSTEIDLDTTLTVKIANANIYEALNQLLPPNITFKKVGNQVVLVAQSIPSKYFTFSGFVYDSATYESLIGVSTYFPELNRGIVTNNYGFYTIKLPAQTYRYTINYLGYKTTYNKIVLQKNTRNDVLLAPKPYQLESVTIKGKKQSTGGVHTLTNSSSTELDVETLRKLPNLFGEGDIVKNISGLPGIITDEASSDNVMIRGGAPHHTMFLLDDAPVLDVSHFGGFFSVFNPDMVKHVKLFKNDMPARYGEAISSVVDVRLREGNKKKWQVKGGIGLISSRLSVEGPIVKNKVSLLVGARRSYIDLLISQPKRRNEDEFQNPYFYFYDANIKLNAVLNKNNKLYLSGYFGRDYLDQYGTLYRNNQLFTLRWNKVWGPRLFMNTTAIYSNKLFGQIAYQNSYSFYLKSNAYQTGIKVDMDYGMSPAWEFKFGLASDFNQYQPYKITPNNEESVFVFSKAFANNVLQNSTYLHLNNKYFDKIRFSTSFRFNLVNQLGPYNQYQYKTDGLIGRYIYDTLHYAPAEIIRTYYSVEPRLSASYLLSSQQQISLGYYHAKQHVHRVNYYTTGITIGRWFSANSEFPPEKSHNFLLSYENHAIVNHTFSANLYYRLINGLVESKGNLNTLIHNEFEFFLYSTRGRAYGAEFMLSGSYKRFQYFANYTFSRCENIIQSSGNPGYFPHTTDKPHVFKTTATWQVSKNISAALQWNYMSGVVYTPIIGQYKVDGKTLWHLDEENINGARLPAYHRLDISIDYSARKNYKRRWKGYWNFSIYNVYWRKNALGILYYTPETNFTDAPESPTSTVPRYYYYYQFVPSVSYRFQF